MIVEAGNIEAQDLHLFVAKLFDAAIDERLQSVAEKLHPLVVAEEIATLSLLAPGRLDIGLGREPCCKVGAAHPARQNYLRALIERTACGKFQSDTLAERFRAGVYGDKRIGGAGSAGSAASSAYTSTSSPTNAHSTRDGGSTPTDPPPTDPRP